MLKRSNNDTREDTREAPAKTEQTLRLEPETTNFIGSAALSGGPVGEDIIDVDHSSDACDVPIVWDPTEHGDYFDSLGGQHPPFTD